MISRPKCNTWMYGVKYISCMLGVLSIACVVAFQDNLTISRRRANRLGIAGCHELHKSAKIVKAQDARDGHELNEAEIAQIQRELDGYHDKLYKEYRNAAEHLRDPDPVEPPHPLRDKRSFLEVEFKYYRE